MQLTIIGAGNMGGAIAHGLFNHKTAADDLQVAVADISQEKLSAIAPYCNATFTDNAIAVAKADIILIAVKPWLVDIVLDTIKPVIENRCPISYRLRQESPSNICSHNCKPAILFSGLFQTRLSPSPKV